MILHGKRKRPATILSEDSVTKIAVGMVWEKIRQALEKILQAELGYLEGATLSGAERKKRLCPASCVHDRRLLLCALGQ
jgi:hypothetical protein